MDVLLVVLLRWKKRERFWEDVVEMKLLVQIAAQYSVGLVYVKQEHSLVGVLARLNAHPNDQIRYLHAVIELHDVILPHLVL